MATVIISTAVTAAEAIRKGYNAISLDSFSDVNKPVWLNRRGKSAEASGTLAGKIS